MRYTYLIVAVVLQAAFSRTDAAERDAPVAVLAFADETGIKEWEGLGAAMADLLEASLSSAGVSMVERRLLNHILAEQELSLAELTDPKSAVRVGELVGAKYLLMGSVRQLGSAIRADVRILDVGTAAIRGAFAVEAGQQDRASLLPAVCDRAIRELGFVNARHDPASLPGHWDTTVALARAISLERDGKTEEALRAYQEGIAVDPLYQERRNRLSVLRTIRYQEAGLGYFSGAHVLPPVKDKPGKIFVHAAMGIGVIEGGRRQWQVFYREKGRSVGSMSLVPPSGDGPYRLFCVIPAIHPSRRFVVLNADTGQKIGEEALPTPARQGVRSPPSFEAVDLEQDGAIECLGIRSFSSGGRHTGTLSLWRESAKQPVWSHKVGFAPAVYLMDCDGDSRKDIVVSKPDAVTVLEGQTGKVLWARREFGGPMAPYVARDGGATIYCRSHNNLGELVRIDAKNGRPLERWQGAHSITSLLAIDLHGQGGETLVIGREKSLNVDTADVHMTSTGHAAFLEFLDPASGLVWERLSGLGRGGRLHAGDLDGDGRPEIVYLQHTLLHVMNIKKRLGLAEFERQQIALLVMGSARPVQRSLEHLVRAGLAGLPGYHLVDREAIRKLAQANAVRLDVEADSRLLQRFGKFTRAGHLVCLSVKEGKAGPELAAHLLVTETGQLKRGPVGSLGKERLADIAASVANWVGDEVGTSPAARPKPAPAKEAPRPGMLRLAVADFDLGEAIDPTGRMARALADLIVSSLQGTPSLCLIERRKFEAVLRERELTKAGFTRQDSLCETARILGAEAALLGQLLPLDDKTIVTLTVLDTESEVVRTSATAICPPDRLRESVEDALKQIRRSLSLADTRFVEAKARFVSAEYGRVTEWLAKRKIARTGTYVEKDLAADTTWIRDGSPYVVRSNLAIMPGATLRIEPGVHVYFSSERRAGPRQWSVSLQPVRGRECAGRFLHCVFREGSAALSCRKGGKLALRDSILQDNRFAVVTYGQSEVRDCTFEGNHCAIHPCGGTLQFESNVVRGGKYAIDLWFGQWEVPLTAQIRYNRIERSAAAIRIQMDPKPKWNRLVVEGNSVIDCPVLCNGRWVKQKLPRHLPLLSWGRNYWGTDDPEKVRKGFTGAARVKLKGVLTRALEPGEALDAAPSTSSDLLVEGR